MIDFTCILSVFQKVVDCVLKFEIFSQLFFLSSPVFLRSTYFCLHFTEFDTSRLEMNHVADMFDKNSRGLIDWKEFIAALRPDWEEKTNNDAQKIHDEVKRLVMLCTCRQKFRVFQVGEGKYRVKSLSLFETSTIPVLFAVW